MSVYVDPLMSCRKWPQWRWTKACHLYSDTLEELHDFAAKLGLKREWFQDDRLPHYDLTPNKRIEAIQNGAIEHTREDAVNMWRKMGWSRLSRPYTTAQKGGAK